METFEKLFNSIAQSKHLDLEEEIRQLYAGTSMDETSETVQTFRWQASQFVLGEDHLGEELQREDITQGSPDIDSSLGDMMQNLGLDPPKASSLEEDDALDILVKIDFEVDGRGVEWNSEKEELQRNAGTSEGQVKLARYLHYFMDTQSAVFRIPVTDGSAPELLKTACIRSLIALTLDVRKVKEGLREGEQSVAADAEFLAGLAKRDPTLLLFAFIPMMLHDYGHLSHVWSDTLLKLLRLGLLNAWNMSEKGIEKYHEKLVSHLPQTLKTARKWFSGIEATTELFAMCPKCSVIHENTPNLPRCNWKQFPDSKPCDEPLLESRSKRIDNQHLAVTFPILPVQVNNFAAWQSKWLQRPGIEKILRRSQEYMGTPMTGKVMHDIRDSASVRDLPHPDGGKFFNGRKHSELRTSWTLYYDAFNPFFNKAAGKTASSAVLGMACQNLPPSMKHKPENLYLMTVLPKDPPVDQNSFALALLFRIFNLYWKRGIFIESTPDSPAGFRALSIIANLVADMLGGSKLGGHAQHNTGKYFCDLCLLLKSNINNVDLSTLPMRTLQSERESALRWRNATSATDRDATFKETGVRWSALYELEYWDPTRMLATDPMHNLFLGLVQYHCRVVMGIDFKKRTSKAKGGHPVYPQFENPKTDQLANGRAKLANAKSATVIERLQKNVLWMMCAERGISLREHVSANKTALANLLWEHQILRDSSSSQQTEVIAHGITGDEILGDDIVSSCAEEMANARTRPIREGMTKAERNKLHRDISSTVRPASHRGPPVNLGEESHGKLKADELRSLAEFDLVVTASQIWAKDNQPGNTDPDVLQRNDKKFRATILLCMAIRVGTSFSASSKHAERYTTYMTEYLRLILQLYPGSTLTPNQHKALHIGPGLEQFGPAFGWWMFPFERLIGILQKTNHNFKIGQLERTMVQTFCNAANMRAFLLDPRCPSILRDSFSIINKAWSMDTLMSDSNRDEQPTCLKETVHQRDTDALRLVQPLQESLKRTPPEFVYTVGALKIGKYGFSSGTINASQCRVFFSPGEGEELVPGEIQHIFKLQRTGQTYFIAVRRFLPLVAPPTSVFQEYPDFGLTLVSERLGDLEVILADHTIHPTTSRMYTKGCLAIKDCSRVSRFLVDV